MFIDLPTLATTSAAPSGDLFGDVFPSWYTSPADFRLVANPAWNGINATSSGQSDAFAKYVVTDLNTSTVYKRDTRFNIPYTPISVAADAARRMGQPGVIELGPGLSLGGITIGANDTNQTNNIYWGAIGGPFTPVTGVRFRSMDPLAPAEINGVTRSAFIKNNAGATVFVGPCSIEFDHVVLRHVPGAKYIFEDILGVNTPHLHGRTMLLSVDFVGNADWGSGYDTKSCIRGAYGMHWNLQDCTFGECEEHGGYIDAPQGGFMALRCRNVASNGLSQPRCGRTLFQIVGRAQTGDPPGVDPYYGGPPGLGRVQFKDCVATRTGMTDYSGAFTVAGFQGEVVVEDCQTPETHGGMLTVWTPTGGGFHSSLGKFIAPTAPNSGTLTTVSVNGAAKTYTRPFNNNINWVVDGFEVGAPVIVSGALNAGNNGVKVAAAVSQSVIAVTSPLVDEPAGHAMLFRGATGPYVSGVSDVTVNATARTYTRASGSWFALTSSGYPQEAFRKNTVVQVGGFATAACNGNKTITALTDRVMTVAEAVGDEAAGAVVAFVGPTSPPYPLPRTAFSTLRVVVKGLTGNAASGQLNPTSAIAISGARLVEFGAFDIQSGGQPVIALWPFQGTQALGGPLDNGEVRFVAPHVAPVASYAGFHGASTKIRYATASLNTAQINALLGTNTAYPPVAPPVFSGALFGGEAGVSTAVPAGSVDFTSSGMNIFLPTVDVVADAPAGDVVVALLLDLPAVAVLVLSPDGELDAPKVIDLPAQKVVVGCRDGTVSFGLDLDLTATSVVLDAPDGTVTFADPLSSATGTYILPVYDRGGGRNECALTSALGYDGAVVYTQDGVGHPIASEPEEQPPVGQLPVYTQDGTRYLVAFELAQTSVGFFTTFGRVQAEVDRIIGALFDAVVVYDNAPEVHYPVDAAQLALARVKLMTTGSSLRGFGVQLNLRFDASLWIDLWTNVEVGAVDVLAAADAIKHAVGAVPGVRFKGHAARRLGLETIVLRTQHVVQPRWGVSFQLDFDFDVTLDRPPQTTPVTGEFLDVANAIQASFDALVAQPAGLQVLYDNSKQPQVDVPWCQFEVDQAEPLGGLVMGTGLAVRRRLGQMTVLINVPVQDGCGAAWNVVDAIVRQFACASRGGAVFNVPNAALIGRSDRWWVVALTCTFSVDDLR